MKNFIKSIYRAITPGYLIRKKSELKEYLFWENARKKVEKNVAKKYNAVSENSLPDDILKALQFLKTNKLQIVPYEFTKKYVKLNTTVYLDEKNGLRYTIYENKRLYFRRSWTEKKIRDYYNYLLMEQDIESPHRYLSAEFNVKENGIIVDAGAAEGIFALSVIEKAGKVYLFEPDSEWVEALQATFEPWKSKTEIIPAYISDHDDSQSCSLDHFFSDKPYPDFIKIDVEGAELEVLKGFESYLSTKEAIQIAVCTYHKQGDEQRLKEYLETRNFNISYSNGFVLFYYDKGIQDPYFRRCIIRATR